MTGGSESWLSWVFKLVNFGILVAVLVKFLGKPFKAFFANRANAVKTKVEEARKALEEAESLKKMYEEKLAKLDEEIAEFRKGVVEKTERERTRILKDAEAQAARIKEQAVLTYEQESREVSTRIKAEIAKLTIDRAEGLVKERITRADHDVMIEDFIQKVRSSN